MKSFVLSLMAVVAMCAMVSCAGGDSIEGKWKVDDASLKKLMGNDASMGKVDATVDIQADKAIATINMKTEGEMKMDMTLEANLDYTKTDKDVTVTPKEVKLVKLDLPESLLKMAKESGMSEEKMKEEFAKEFTSKKPEPATLSYTLADGKLTLKDEKDEIVLVRE